MSRVGINGFGRMGRLALRAGVGSPDLAFVHVNEIAGDAASHAFWSWSRSAPEVEVSGEVDGLLRAAGD